MGGLPQRKALRRGVVVPRSGARLATGKRSWAQHTTRTSFVEQQLTEKTRAARGWVRWGLQDLVSKHGIIARTQSLPPRLSFIWTGWFCMDVNVSSTVNPSFYRAQTVPGICVAGNRLANCRTNARAERSLVRARNTFCATSPCCCWCECSRRSVCR